MPYLTPPELAVRWKVTEKTLANWRLIGRPPRFTKINGNIRYDEDDVVAEERRCRFASTTEATEAQKARRAALKSEELEKSVPHPQPRRPKNTAHR